jgi:putative chitinase
MTVRATDIVTKFAPAAKPVYAQAFADPGGLLQTAGIVTPLRLAHLMTQCLHETGAFSLLVESGRYSANALGTMWDSGNWHRYFADRAACVAMATQCAVDGGVELFSLVYGERMGNGPSATRDGWNYRGRGILQTTGRESYGEFGRACGVPFEADPDLVVSAAHALKPALSEWTSKNVNAMADRNDIVAVTKAINGGTVGLAERRAWFAKVWPFVIGTPPARNTREWKVQAALVLAGYNSGNPDGDVGPTTRGAILKYRADKGLGTSPTITQDLLTALRVE